VDREAYLRVCYDVCDGTHVGEELNRYSGEGREAVTY
jgi:hypothetical protein